MNRAIAGYELEHRLGEGGGGTVWRARQMSSLGRPVALKRMRVASEGERARLRHEASVLAELDHPRIVKVFEIVDDGDEIAIAMQLAAGGSLADRLARRVHLSPPAVARIAADLADALASAHRRGVVHGDVSPSNILFTSDGEVLLTDFGTARRAGDEAPVIEGTPGYVAPEVLSGSPADERSDIYSLGAVCHELLTGVTPDVARPPAGDDVPAWLTEVVARAAAPDRAVRFESAVAFATALRTEGREAAPPTPVTFDAPTPDARIHTVAHTREFGPRPPRPVEGAAGAGIGRWGAAALAGVSILVVASIAIAVVAIGRPGIRHRARPGASAAPTPPKCVAPRPPVTDATRPEVLTADVDGDGCPDAVLRRGNVLIRTGPDGHAERYAIGREGDVAVLGDWDCDGVATPAAFRPTTHQAFLFDRWADRGDLTPASTITATRPPIARCHAGRR